MFSCWGCHQMDCVYFVAINYVFYRYIREAVPNKHCKKEMVVNLNFYFNGAMEVGVRLCGEHIGGSGAGAAATQLHFIIYFPVHLHTHSTQTHTLTCEHKRNFFPYGTVFMRPFNSVLFIRYGERGNWKRI